MLHSYGAIQCLEKLLGLVDDDGFILVNDYGQAEIKSDDDYERQQLFTRDVHGREFPVAGGVFRGGGQRNRTDC